MAQGSEDYNQGINIKEQSIDRISTITKAPSGTTAVYKSGIIAGDAIILHTITAGKTLYLTSTALAIGALDTSGNSYVAVRNTSDIIQYYLIRHNTKATTGNSGNVAFSIQLSPPLNVPEGWDIIIYSPDINISAAATISGWEE